MSETPITELKNFIMAQIEVHEALGNHSSREARKSQLAALCALETALAAKQAELTAFRKTYIDVRRALEDWQTLRLWGGTPAHVHAFIKGQQDRIHATQDIEQELSKAYACIRALTDDDAAQSDVRRQHADTIRKAGEAQNL